MSCSVRPAVGWVNAPSSSKSVPCGSTGAFADYKQSGIGREWGRLKLEEFCEIKSLSWA
jgi:acyl-CoA reductase-like NAD-dependent aldehyde dehydrogenase